MDLNIYIEQIDHKWKEAYLKLLDVIKASIPSDFELRMQYDMPTYVVPLTIFPEGYLERKDEPLPFISLAAQKNHIALYHMGIMGNKELLEWFQKEYAKQVPTKLNMGKSCIRFTNTKNIPYALIGELMTKISVNQWIESYQKYANRQSK